ncbi:MAG: hypothetical protein AAFX06_07250 [Planctomycetota bacterium]
MDFTAGVLVGVFATLALSQFFEFVFVTRYWFRAMMSEARIGVVAILRLRFKGCPVPLIIDTYCALIHSGYDVTLRDVESLYVANRFERDIEDPSSFLDRAKATFNRRRPDECAEVGSSA